MVLPAIVSSVVEAADGERVGLVVTWKILGDDMHVKLIGDRLDGGCRSRRLDQYSPNVLKTNTW